MLFRVADKGVSPFIGSVFPIKQNFFIDGKFQPREISCMDTVYNNPNDKTFFELVYEAVRLIPEGKVASYGQIAKLCGSPRSSRAVGYALHVNPLPGIVPCHRVVNREGRLAPAFAFGGALVQKELLEREGVEVFEKDGLFYVSMEKFRWNP